MIPEIIYIVYDYLELEDIYNLIQCSKIFYKVFKNWHCPKIVELHFYSQEQKYWDEKMDIVKNNPHIKFDLIFDLTFNLVVCSIENTIDFSLKNIRKLTGFDKFDLKDADNVKEIKCNYFLNSNTNYLKNCKYLYIEYPSRSLNISNMLKLESLTLHNAWWITNIKPFMHLHKLDIRHSGQITNYLPIKNSNIKILSICGSNYPIDIFENLDELTIIHNDNLVAPIGLGHLKKLELIECSELNDVTHLSHISDLTIEFCYNVQHINFYGEKLTVRYCEIIKCITGLNLKFIEFDRALSHIHPIMNISKNISIARFSNYSMNIDYENLTELSLLDNKMIEEVKPLFRSGKLRKLFLKNCPNLTSIDGIKGLQQLTLSCCRKLTDISPLTPKTNPQLRKLDLSNSCFINLYIIGRFKKFKILLLRNISNLKNIKFLANIKIINKLNLDYYNGNIDLSPLKNVRINSLSLQFVAGWKGLEKLNIPYIKKYKLEKSIGKDITLPVCIGCGIVMTGSLALGFTSISCVLFHSGIALLIDRSYYDRPTKIFGYTIHSIALINIGIVIGALGTGLINKYCK